MNKTITEILNHETARSSEAVELSLAHELSAGSPWLNEDQA